MSESQPNHGADRVPASRYALFVGLTIAGLGVDLWSKWWVFSWLRPLGSVYWFVPGYVGLQTSLNEGALFGMGQGAVAVFAAVSLVAAAAIPLWLFVWKASRDVGMTLILGLVMGGVLGNLNDRLGMTGLVWPAPDPRAGEPVYAVRDFILWQAGDAYRWPNFNIADALLVVGAALLFIKAWLEPAEPAEQDDPEEGKPVTTDAAAR
ncbi:MAG: signal peptidase II [Planctomycetota bacterium]